MAGREKPGVGLQVIVVVEKQQMPRRQLIVPLGPHSKTQQQLLFDGG